MKVALCGGQRGSSETDSIKSFGQSTNSRSGNTTEWRNLQSFSSETRFLAVHSVCALKLSQSLEKLNGSSPKRTVSRAKTESKSMEKEFEV